MLDTRKAAINLAGLSFLLVDPNPHASTIVHGILRGFGATRVVEARTADHAIQVLNDQKIDMMLVDPSLANGRGLAFIRSLRKDPNNPFRTMPILVVTADTRTSTVSSTMRPISTGYWPICKSQLSEAGRSSPFDSAAGRLNNRNTGRRPFATAMDAPIDPANKMVNQG